MNIGIVGHEGAKFTTQGEVLARAKIREIYDYYARLATSLRLVSGACHLGGIDIWAEEEADKLGIEKLIFPPKTHSWTGGYKPRNIKIAQTSDVIYVIVVDRVSPSYKGMTFKACYHCGTTDHVKSGGCWTAKQVSRMGKQTYWIIIPQ